MDKKTIMEDCMNSVARVSIALLALAMPLVLAPTSSGQDWKFMQGQFSPEIERALNSPADLLGKEVLAKGEPSFASVSRYFPPMQRPQAVIGVKDSPHDFGVSWSGAIRTLGPYQGIFFHLGDPPSPYGSEGTVSRKLLDGYLPAVETTWRLNGLQYQELAFAHSEGLSPDTPSFAYVRLRVANPNASPKRAAVSLAYYPGFGLKVPIYKVDIAAHGHHDFHFKIPYAADSEHPVIAVDPEQFDGALREVKAFWMELLAKGMQIETPEARVNDAYRAWLEYNFLNVDKIKDNFEVHDGAGFYEEVYGYSAALYCHALSLMGFWDDAEKYLISLLKFQHDDGSIVTPDYGVPDNGAILFALSEHLLVSHHWDWFKRVAPAMTKSCEWIARSRASTKVLTGGEKALSYGLLPAAKSYCDFSRPIVSYYSDTYNWLGMHQAALAFQEAGMKDEAERWLRESEEYRQDITTSMDRATVRVGDLDVLPIEPLTHRLMNEGGGDYYGLIGSATLETGFFAPGDARAGRITRFMEERGGLLLGVSRFGEGTDHAYTYGYAITQLLGGEINKFLLTFYTSLAYGMSRGTYSAVEGSHVALGINELTLPHTYSNTQQLRWLRMMLLYEDGKDLNLAPATPRAWLGSGKALRVKNGVTRFGKVSYELHPSKENHTVHAVIAPLEDGGRPRPAVVKLALRAPGNWGQLVRAQINGRHLAKVVNETIEIDGSLLQQKVDVDAYFQPRADSPQKTGK